MIIIDGQKVLEENVENNIKNDQKIPQNTEININKVKKTPIRQFIMKLFEIFCETLLMCFIYFVLKDYYKIYKYDKGRGYIYYEDIVFNILFIAVCFFTIYTNLSNLFKYENDYKSFNKFKKLYQKIQEFNDKISNDEQYEKKLKIDEKNNKEKDNDIEVRFINSIYPLVSNLFGLFDSRTKDKSNSQLVKNIFFPKIRRRRRYYYSNNKKGLSKFENFIMKLAVFLLIIFIVVFIGFLIYISKRK